jgi:twitching motility two-component system response regulator PilG
MRVSQSSPSAWLREGIEAAKAKQHDKARFLLQRVIQLEPANEHAWVWLATVAKSSEDAVAYLTLVLQRNPANPNAQAWLKWHQDRISKQGDIKNCPLCVAILTEAVSQCPNCGSLLSLSAVDRVLSNQGAIKAEIESAIVRLQTLLQTGRSRFHYFSYLALAHLNLGDLDNTIATLEKALQEQPGHADMKALLDGLKRRKFAGSSTPQAAMAEAVHAAVMDGIGGTAPTPSAAKPAPTPANLKPRPAAATPGPVAPRAAAKAGQKYVLLVDDSITVQKMVVLTLERAGYLIKTASNGLEAMATLGEEVPDIVLLDITLPMQDGFKLCEFIKKQESTAQVPVVFLSGRHSNADRERSRQVGASDYITKPFSPDELVRVVHTYTSDP